MPWYQFFQLNNFAGVNDAYIFALSSCLFVEELLKKTSFILSNKGVAWLGITTAFYLKGVPMHQLW